MPWTSLRSPLRLLLIAAAVLAASAAPVAAQDQVESIGTDAGPVSVVNVASGLEYPWGLAFLPDGRMLVTEHPGRLRIVTSRGDVSAPVEGTPDVWYEGQGGLMDVAVDPDFATNGYVYLSYAESAEEGGETVAGTALGRGRLVDDRIEGFEVIFRQMPKVPGPNHFGNRIAFSPEGHVFLALGERFKFEPAQDLSNTLGTVVRIRPDGSIPEDNPFVDDPNAEDAIWSYGHRNIEAAAVDPATGNLWIVEMGPLGGDELNMPMAGRNYGWPVVSWGRHYDGEPIPDPPTRPEFADAVVHWTPVISPSGMTFYTGDVFPEWQGSAFVGGLSDHSLVRVRIDGETAEEAERIPLPTRIREVEAGPDGHLYVLTDQENGNVWRVEPLRGE